VATQYCLSLGERANGPADGAAAMTARGKGGLAGGAAACRDIERAVLAHGHNGQNPVGRRSVLIRDSSGLPVHARTGLAGRPLGWGAGAAALYQKANAGFQWYPANQKGEALPRRHAPHGLRVTGASTGDSGRRWMSPHL
jgi:hypothetical protein